MSSLRHTRQNWMIFLEYRDESCPILKNSNKFVKKEIRENWLAKTRENSRFCHRLIPRIFLSFYPNQYSQKNVKMRVFVIIVWLTKIGKIGKIGKHRTNRKNRKNLKTLKTLKNWKNWKNWKNRKNWKTLKNWKNWRNWKTSLRRRRRRLAVVVGATFRAYRAKPKIFVCKAIWTFFFPLTIRKKFPDVWENQNLGNWFN